MPWKHVIAPTKGLVDNKPGTAMEDQASPYMKGIVLKDGEVRSDFGMVNYPVPSGTKTNALNGVFMGTKQFFLLDGTSYNIAFTTKHLYNYNTTTDTWDVLTKGVELDDCEDAWDAKSNVTSTADATVKLRGSKCAKHVIASAFTTGIVSSEDDVSNADISASTNTHLSFWVYCDTAVAADVFSLRISEQAAGATGATYADYYIPAITANTWLQVNKAIASPDADNGGTYPDDLNAVASVALVANSDPGAVTIYVDDIRTAQCFTGDEDNKFSTAVLNDTMVVTNGIDAPTKLHISGSLTHAALTLTLPAGAITTCEVVLAFKDHMLYFNNTENGGDAPQRCSWSNIGDIADHTSGTAGYQDLLDDDSWVLGAALLSENEVAVYKERSIVQCVWVGGHTPFRFRTIIHDRGIVNKDCLVYTDKGHAVMDDSNVFIYNGTNETIPLDNSVQQTIYGRMDGAYTDRAFLMNVDEDNEIQVWIPASDTIPDEGYTFNMVDLNWYVKNRSISGYGFYKAQSSLTIGDLTGTIGEQDWTFGSQLIKEFFPITLVGDDTGKVYQLDKSSLNNAGTAIVNEFQTPDFVLPGEAAYMNEDMRVAQFIFEAKGQSVTVTYSTDGGNSWSPTQGASTNVVSLDSNYKDYQQFFEVIAKRIRFKFYNNTASSGFQLRHYAFYWLKRTGRR